MLRQEFLLVPVLLASPAAAGDLLAIKVGRAETVSHGVIEHAVILVEDGKIVTIGEDLPIERGVPVLDRPAWTAAPGFVSCYTRLGMDSAGGDDMSPEVKARDELWPRSRELRKVVEHGVTTLGVYPAGNGIPGQAVAIRPLGDDVEALVLKDSPYLKIVMRADSASKKRIHDGFKKADDHEEKVAKAREKWEKDQEKKKSSSKKTEEKKDTEKKDEEKKDGAAAEDSKPDTKGDAKSDGFQAPAPDEKVRPFLELRAGTLNALVAVSGAAEYLHWLDALGEEKIGWDLRVVLAPESDIFYVLDKKTYDLDVDGIGDRKLRVVVDPLLTVTPNTRRVRNLPMELARAGARVCFTPRDDDLGGYERWRDDVGELVGAGLDPQTALRGLTLEPAGLLGVEDRVGSLDKGKDANLVFFDGDPLTTGTRVQAVMLDGRFVHGEVNQ